MQDLAILDWFIGVSVMEVAARCFLFKFKFGGNTAFILEFGNKYIRFFADHGQVITDSAIYEIATPYTLDDLWDQEQEVCRLQITQNADVLYLWHKKYMKTLTRYGNTDWRLEDFELINGPWDHMNTSNTTMTASGTLGTVTVTATNDVFAKSDVGRLLRLHLVDDDTTPWSSGKSVKSGDIYTSDGKWYKATADGTTGGVKPVHSEGTRSDGGVVWDYLHSGYGIAKITEFTNAKSVNVSVLTQLPNTKATANWELGMLHSAGNYPISGAFFKNRLAMLINTSSGVKCILSKIDDFNNFADKEGSEVLSENAITVPVLSEQYNEGTWLSSGDVLFVGTNNGEFYIDSITSSEAMGPDNVTSNQISTIGSKPIPPMKINGHTLFVDRFGTSIRDLAYSYERDGYDPYDVSIKGKHLLKSGIVSWDYQDYPDKILWCVVSDGRLIGFTFNSEQQVSALHRHTFGGSVESVAIIPSPDQKKEDCWISVKRNVAGSAQRYIEWVDEGEPVVFPDSIEAIENYSEKEVAESNYVKENSHFLDSCLEFNRSPGDPVTTLKGLDHLKGAVVRIMADGAQKEDQVVSDEGTIEIASTDNHVLVGLPIQSVFKAQKRYIQTDRTFGVGEVQQIDHLCIMLYRSGGGKVGGNYNELVDILYRDTDAEMGKSAELFTGNKVIPWSTRSSTIEEKGADIFIVNDSIYPMTVLAISPQMTQSEG